MSSYKILANNFKFLWTVRFVLPVYEYCFSCPATLLKRVYLVASLDSSIQKICQNNICWELILTTTYIDGWVKQQHCYISWTGVDLTEISFIKEFNQALSNINFATKDCKERFFWFFLEKMKTNFTEIV